MAYQINASYSEQLHFDQIPPRDLYALLLEGAKELGWTVAELSNDHITAYARLSITSFGEVIHMEINQSVVTVTSTCLMPQFLSLGKNKRNIRRLTRKINFLTASLSEEDLAASYLNASAQFIGSQDAASASSIYTHQLTEAPNKISSFLSIFNPKPGYFVTPILINLCIGYYILLGLAGAGFFNYNLQGFEDYGVNASTYVITLGQWWRLLTASFIHAGLLHLLGNMFALVMIGVYLEPVFGRLRMLLFYLLSGVAGGLLSIYLHPFRATVGASGAIYGLYGIFLALLSSDIIEKNTRKAIFNTLIFFILLDLLLGWQIDSVDNSSHVGGLLTGILLGGLSINSINKGNPFAAAKQTITLSVVAIMLFFFCLKIMPDQVRHLQRKMLQLTPQITMVISYRGSLMDTTKDENTMRTIRYQSLGFAKQNAHILDEIDALRIGKTGHKKVQELRNYTALQVKEASFTLQYLASKRTDDRYMDSINYYHYLCEDMEYALSHSIWQLE